MAATYLDEVTADLPPAASEPDLIAESRLDETLRFGTVLVGLCWAISGVMVLADTIWKFVD